MSAFDFPASPTVGQIYTVLGGPTYVWNGYAWVLNSSLIAVAPPGDVPPATPVNGQLWWESDTGNLFLWYTDANTSQWVQISGPGLGDAPSDGESYVRKNGLWVEAPRVQRFDVAGLNTKTLTVPVGAMAMRLTGSFFYTENTNNWTLMAISVAAGVSIETPGSYVLSGFTQGSGMATPGISNFNNNTAYAAMLLSVGNDNGAIATQFTADMGLKKPTPNLHVFTCVSRSTTTYLGDPGMQHSFLRNYAAVAATGAATSILAMRVISAMGYLWLPGSYLIVEWF